MARNAHSHAIAPLSARAPRARPGLFARLRFALTIRRERDRLAALSDHELSDLGLTRRQVLRETTRSFWDLPDRRG